MLINKWQPTYVGKNRIVIKSVTFIAMEDFRIPYSEYHNDDLFIFGIRDLNKDLLMLYHCYLRIVVFSVFVLNHNNTSLWPSLYQNAKNCVLLIATLDQCLRLAIPDFNIRTCRFPSEFLLLLTFNGSHWFQWEWLHPVAAVHHEQPVLRAGVRWRRGHEPLRRHQVHLAARVCDWEYDCKLLLLFIWVRNK